MAFIGKYLFLIPPYISDPLIGGMRRHAKRLYSIALSLIIDNI